MKKAILLALLLLLLPIASAQQSKISTKDADDYRDISVTPEGFQIKDPYALPVYEPKSTSLLPFHEKISSLLNSYLGKLLSNFDVKEAFALRILFEDIEPILSFLGDLLSLPITCIALPFLSLARLIKLPLDILEFLITAILEPIFSIPADEIALLRSCVLSLGNVLSFPLKALKPIEFLVYTPDPLRSLPDSLSLTSSFFTLYSSTLQPLISCVSEAMSCLPLLNVIKVLIDAYLLPILRTPLKLLPLFAPYADDPQVSSLMNLISLPASLPMLALQQLMLFAEDLASVIVLPLLFALRIPLTPLLMLLNFLSHSLEGWKEYVNLTTFYTLIPTLVLVAPVILLALLSFVVSIPLSILLAPMLGIVILLAALLLVLVGLVAMLGAPALILVALAGAVAGGVIGPIAGAIIGIVAASLLGLIIWALPSISLIPTGVGALAALVLGAIIAIVMLTAGAVIGAVAGGIAGILLGALAALALGILAGSLFALILLAIAGGVVAFLLLSMLLLPVLSLFTLPALVIAITLIGTIGGGIVWYLIVAIITGLISSLLAPITASVGSISILLLGALCLVSVISPELFRVLVPPELTALLARTIYLPTGIARIINGLVHLPADMIRAIAVLDAPAKGGVPLDIGITSDGKISVGSDYWSFELDAKELSDAIEGDSVGKVKFHGLPDTGWGAWEGDLPVVGVGYDVDENGKAVRKVKLGFDLSNPYPGIETLQPYAEMEITLKENNETEIDLHGGMDYGPIEATAATLGLALGLGMSGRGEPQPKPPTPPTQPVGPVKLPPPVQPPLPTQLPSPAMGTPGGIGFSQKYGIHWNLNVSQVEKKEYNVSGRIAQEIGIGIGPWETMGEIPWMTTEFETTVEEKEPASILSPLELVKEISRISPVTAPMTQTYIELYENIIDTIPEEELMSLPEAPAYEVEPVILPEPVPIEE